MQPDHKTPGGYGMHVRSLLRLTFLFCTVLSATTFTQSAFAADLDTQVSIDIPAQSLDSALLELSKQASFQLVLDSRAVTAKSTAAVAGRMAIREAPDRLLGGTGPIFRLSVTHTPTHS